MRYTIDLDVFINGLKDDIGVVWRSAAKTSVCIERVALELPVSITPSTAGLRIGAPVCGSVPPGRIHVSFVRYNGPEEDCK